MFVYHHVALSVTDLQKSIKFYAVFGFKKVYEWIAEDKSLTIINLKNEQVILELFCYSKFKEAPEYAHTVESDLPVIGTKHFGLKVTSIREARDFVIRNNLIKDVQVTHGRTGVDYFFIQDPDGIWIEIIQDDRNL